MEIWINLISTANLFAWRLCHEYRQLKRQSEKLTFCCNLLCLIMTISFVTWLNEQTIKTFQTLYCLLPMKGSHACIQFVIISRKINFAHHSSGSLIKLSCWALSHFLPEIETQFLMGFTSGARWDLSCCLPTSRRYKGAFPFSKEHRTG